MVRSTRPQTAKYLRSVALGEVALADKLAGWAAAQEKQMACEAAKWQWATAAQWALALTLTSSQRDLQVGALEVLWVAVREWRWATAAQWAMALTLTSSQRDLQAMCSDSKRKDRKKDTRHPNIGSLITPIRPVSCVQAMCNDNEGEEGENSALVAVTQSPTFQRGVLEETRGAAQVLQAVLGAAQRGDLVSADEATAVGRQVVDGCQPRGAGAGRDGEAGLALMAKQVQAKLEADGSLRDSASSAGAVAGGRWAQLAATGEEMAGGRVPGGGTWVRLVATGEETAVGRVVLLGGGRGCCTVHGGRVVSVSRVSVDGGGEPVGGGAELVGGGAEPVGGGAEPVGGGSGAGWGGERSRLGGERSRSGGGAEPVGGGGEADGGGGEAEDGEGEGDGGGGEGEGDVVGGGVGEEAEPEHWDWQPAPQ
ncbi:unnamed protein product [Closterium sp. NIES-64]|nr:unnamed protein product [Closterium sp. NIES-64]